MRLTRDVITSAPQCINPIQDRSISLRGFRVVQIENLGVTKDAFDCIDLCDNDIVKLDDFPSLPRLSSLLIANNRIARIAPDLHKYIPGLKHLVLTNNSLELLRDLLPLTEFKHLERLQLVNNPVTNLPHYRNFLVHKIPSLRYIDFTRIRLREREAAKTFFEADEGKSFLENMMSTGSSEEIDENVV